MRIGSLFSGYGGLDLAVAAHYNATVAWHVEFDAAPSQVLAHHYPDIPNYGDVTSVDWAAVEPVDIITGGYPCQPFSHAGQRRGTNDDRHLWPYVADAIRVLRPRICVFENVAGHLTLGFDTVLADLAALGMDVRWGVVSAAEAGAPHRRERLWIVATDAKHDGRDGTPVRRGASQGEDQGRMLQPEGRNAAPSTDPRGGQLARTTVGADRLPEPAQRGVQPDGLTLLPTPVASVSDPAPWKPGVDWWLQSRAARNLEAIVVGNTPLLPTPAVNDMGEGKTIEWWDEWSVRQKAADGRPAPHGKSLAIEAQRLLPTPTAADTRDGKHVRQMSLDAIERGASRGVDLNHLFENEAVNEFHMSEERLLPTPTAGLGAGGGQRSHRWAEGSKRTHNPVELAHDIADGVITDFGPYTAAIARWEAVMGRPAPAPTEPGKNGRPRLSPRFVEWLMGLPDGWVTDAGISRTAQLKALGNGVVWQQALLALRMLEVAA